VTTKKPTTPEEPVMGELVKAATGEVARDGDHISQYLNREVEDPEVTARQTHAAIIHQILNAPDLDSVLELFEPQTLADFENRHLRIDHFNWQESDFEQGPKVYVSIMCVDVDADTKHLINSGEQRIMAQLMRFEQLDAFPVDVRVHLATKANRFGRRLATFAKWVPANG
jgi:hypothetical protein